MRETQIDAYKYVVCGEAGELLKTFENKPEERVAGLEVEGRGRVWIERAS